MRGEQTAEGGRDEDVHVGGKAVLRAGPGGTRGVGEHSSALVDVGGHQGRAGVGEHAQYVPADAAEAGHGDAARGQIG
ncbi:hypothetical protein AB0B62_18630 [Micromonospora chalcea]|uniref:hypothetical protein n=1 Tax=Micromonospora chalcea TaxID=1874 RepID=UPI0033ED1284